MGGTEAIPNQFPWMAHILVYNSTSNQQYTCGGTLISNKHVLTAAHCFYDDSLGTVSYSRMNQIRSITLGAHDFSATSNDRNRQVVSWSSIHPTNFGVQIKENDIIIITLWPFVNLTGI